MATNLIERIVSKRAAIDEICTKYGATNIRVYGACLRSNRRKECAIDILLCLPSALAGFDYFDSLNRLRLELKVLLSAEVNLQDEDALIGKSRKRILAEAIPLMQLVGSSSA